MIAVHNLSHHFHQKPALSGISFVVEKGESVALLGANGAGKTTLFLRLCGVLPGRSGEATIAGLDPAIERAKLPAVVGVVFQNPDDQLFCPTLLDDVAFGPLNLGETPAQARKEAELALDRVGLLPLADRPPSQLSGGEKRRAAVAGVLAMRPDVLMLDEPTAFLDPRGRRELIALLRELPGTKLIATHDLELARELCPRSLVLADGQLVADRPTAELLAGPLDEFGL